VARSALASAFLISGIGKSLDFSGTLAEVGGLISFAPAIPIAVAVIATQLCGSLLLIFGGGLGRRIGAAWLAAFTLAATLLAHNFWSTDGAVQQQEMNVFFEHLGLIGGFALVFLTADEKRYG
jgi:uncharacterized membrane protein YphA (DoxX/SURF4 family)